MRELCVDMSHVVVHLGGTMEEEQHEGVGGTEGVEEREKTLRLQKVERDK